MYSARNVQECARAFAVVRQWTEKQKMMVTQRRRSALFALKELPLELRKHIIEVSELWSDLDDSFFLHTHS